MKNKNYKGLTFIEMIISIGILSLLLMVSIALFASYTKGRSSIKQNEQATEEAANILDELAKKLRMSNCDYDPGGDGYGIDGGPRECDIEPDSFYCTGGCNDFNAECRIKVRSNADNRLIEYVFDNGPFNNLTENITDYSGVLLSSKVMTNHVRGLIFVPNISHCFTPEWVQGVFLFQIKILKMGDDDNSASGVLVQTSVSQRSGYYEGRPSGP